MYLILKQNICCVGEIFKGTGVNIAFCKGDFVMRHCCKFNADDVYYLEDNNLYTSRKLSIGYCPICNKFVAELAGLNISGDLTKEKFVGQAAISVISKLKDEIVYSLKELNYMKFKSKPFGWKYGVNKTCLKNGKQITKQYAVDFYGNSELIKTV